MGSSEERKRGEGGGGESSTPCRNRPFMLWCGERAAAVGRVDEIWAR